MKKCYKCGNKIRNNAKYCDKCKTLLKLKNPEIVYNLKKYESMQYLKNALIEGSKLLKTREDGTIYAEMHIEFHYETILSYLYECTNLEKQLKSQNISEKHFFYPLMNMLDHVKNYPEDEILDEFLYKINEKYRECKKNKEEVFKFIFYTNIKRNDSNKIKFKKLLDIFNLKIFEHEYFKFKDDEDERITSNFRSEYVLLEYTAKGKDLDLLEKEALNKIYLFYGYLTFIHKFKKRTERHHINQMTLNHKISDLSISSVIILNEEGGFIDFDEAYMIIDTEIKLKKSKLIKFRNINMNYDEYCLIYNSNKKIMEKINQYLILYYLASKEEDLGNSFMKFWSLSEKIIKKINGGGYTKDESVLKYMKNVLKIYPFPKYIQNRLKFLKNKRNSLVHENKDTIKPIDRDIIKLVSECLIYFLMYEINNVNRITDYKIILNAMNQDNKNTIRILTDIESRKIK